MPIQHVQLSNDVLRREERRRVSFNVDGLRRLAAEVRRSEC